MNDYYTSGGIELIDVIESYGLDFNEGNVLKYISRAGKKDKNAAQDYAKAVYYNSRRIKGRIKEPFAPNRTTDMVPHIMHVIEAHGGNTLDTRSTVFDVLYRRYDRNVHRALTYYVCSLYSNGITDAGYFIASIDPDTLKAQLVNIHDITDKYDEYIYSIPSPVRSIKDISENECCIEFYMEYIFDE